MTNRDQLPQLLYATTPDGWRLALHHWPARQRSRRHPVLMVHGLASNRLNLDLDERYSVAQAASRRGFDVFVLEVRGAGLSRAPGGRDRHSFEWTFGDLLGKDVPSAMHRVLEITGAEQLHGFGHSMGGMLFYALGTHRPPTLRSITAVASPLIRGMKLGSREKRLLAIATKWAPENILRRVPLRRLAGAAGRFIPFSTRLADGLLLNAANTEPYVMTRMATEAIDDVPLSLMLQMSEHITSGNGPVGPFAYEEELDRIKVPVYAMGGSVDRIAPPDSVAAAAARIHSSDVRYREMGIAHGDRADYGHGDLLIGRNAPEEVFPRLLDFLEEVD